MTAVLALSVSSEIEKYGAYAGLAAVVGLGVLSLLYFAQAREVKRLREWAGRAPERDADVQQRVVEEAQRRAAAPAPRPQPTHPAAPATPAAVAAAAPGAAQTAAPPGHPGTPTGPRPPVPATAAAVAAKAGAPTPAPAPGQAPATPAPAAPALEPSGPAKPAAATRQPAVAAAAAPPATATPPAAPAKPPTPAPATPPATPAAAPPAPATAAARPAPQPQPAAAAAAPPQRPRPRPAAARRAEPPSRPPAPEGSRRGLVGVIAGGIAIAAIAVLLITQVFAGDETSPERPNTVGTPTTDASGQPVAGSRPQPKRDTTRVAVFNGTTVTGLARAAADKLTAAGYKNVSPVRTDTTNQARATTAVYWQSGSRREGVDTARIIGVDKSALVVMDQNARVLSGGAPVVVFIGADQAQ